MLVELEDSLHDPWLDACPVPVAGVKAAFWEKAADPKRAAAPEDVVACIASLGVLIFVAIVWMLSTFLVVGIAYRVGWPEFLGEPAFYILAPVPLLFLLALVLRWREVPGLVVPRWRGLLEVASRRCPRCGVESRPGTFRRIGLLFSVVLAGLGLPGQLVSMLILLVIVAGLRFRACAQCGHRG